MVPVRHSVTNSQNKTSAILEIISVSYTTAMAYCCVAYLPLIEMRDMQTATVNLPVPLYNMPFRELLTAFGAGKPTPGSGAAAAATGAFACELVSANAKITIRLSKSGKARSHSEYVEEQLALRRPILADLTQRDNDLFGSHIKKKICQKRLS
jgi:Formiminotransferase-cyclodeaminase